MALYRVRAHIHHYTEYMELEDIAAAAGSLTDMISAYNESECRTSCLCAPCALCTSCCVSYGRRRRQNFIDSTFTRMHA